MPTSMEVRQHWDNVYARGPVDQTGWYEANPAVSLELINNCKAAPESPILDIGSGASTLVLALVGAGYQHVIAADISRVALDALRHSLGPRAEHVTFVCDDATRPSALLDVGQVGVWHDRALFHFLTEPADRTTYMELLRKLLRPGGYAIIAAFATDGAEYCSGLPVQRYDEPMLAEALGAGFTLVESRRFTYTQPSGGLRPYVYARFQRRPLG